MAVRKYGEGPRGVPEPGRTPNGDKRKISSKLAQSVGDTTRAVEKLRMEQGTADLEGRCSKKAPTKNISKINTAVKGHMPKWHPYK